MASSRISRANSFTCWSLTAITFLSAAAIGSNRPQFWLLCLGLLSVVAALYFALAAKSQGRLGAPSSWAKNLSTLGVIYVAAVILQTALLQLLSDGAPLITIAFGTVRILAYVLFGWLCIQALGNGRRALLAARVTVLGVSCVAFYGLISAGNPELLPYEKAAYDGYATGPFINRNSFATFLAMGMSLSLALALAPQRQSSRRERTQADPFRLDKILGNVLAFAPVPLLLSCVLLTGSRMGLFVTLLGAGIVISLSGRFAQVHRGKLTAGLTLAAVGLALAFTLTFGQATFDRLGSTGDSADVRGQLYATVAQMIADTPLLGHGLDNFPLAYRAYHAAPVSADIRWDQAHNTYLELWAELGLVAGSLPILICVLCFWRCWARARCAGQRYPQLAAAGAAALAIGAVHSTVDFSLEIPANVFMLILIVCLGLAPRQVQGT